MPVAHGRALFEAAAGPKEIQVFPGVGHNDLVPLAGEAYAEAVVSWVRELEPV